MRFGPTYAVQRKQHGRQQSQPLQLGPTNWESSVPYGKEQGSNPRLPRPPTMPDKDWSAQLVREVASKQHDNAGDGTTTATVLASSIAREGAKAVAAGLNPMDLKRGIDLAVQRDRRRSEEELEESLFERRDRSDSHNFGQWRSFHRPRNRQGDAKGRQ